MQKFLAKQSLLLFIVIILSFFYAFSANVRSSVASVLSPVHAILWQGIRMRLMLFSELRIVPTMVEGLLSKRNGIMALRKLLFFPVKL